MSIDELEEAINWGGQYFSTERFEKWLKLLFEEEITPVNLTQKKGDK